MATQITNRDDFKAFCTDNKYCKWYFNIIDNALARGWTKKTSQVYVESHHIIPKSILKNNDTVILTAREHFICHLLLPKFINSTYKHSMLHALWHISHHMKESRNLKIGSKTYENLKQQFSIMMSEKNTGKKYGEKHGAFGYKHTEEHKKYMSELLKRENNPMFGKKHSEHLVFQRSKKYYFVCGGEKLEVFNLRKFCRDNLLDQGAMTRVNSGKQINHKGYSKWHQ